MPIALIECCLHLVTQRCTTRFIELTDRR